jgi:hypothetical protein
MSLRVSPEALRLRLDAYAERHGTPVRKVILEAIREKLDREEQDPGRAPGR